MPTNVRVTREHLRFGAPNKKNGCAVALAIKDMLRETGLAYNHPKFGAPEVDSNRISYSLDDGYRYTRAIEPLNSTMPRNCRVKTKSLIQAVTLNDAGRSDMIVPFSFHLDCLPLLKRVPVRSGQSTSSKRTPAKKAGKKTAKKTATKQPRSVRPTMVVG